MMVVQEDDDWAQGGVGIWREYVEVEAVFGPEYCKFLAF